MELIDSIRQFRVKLDVAGKDINKSLKAQHWLYRSNDEIQGAKHDPSITNPLILASQMNERELNELCYDLSAINETLGDLEKIAMNELNYREFGTAKHTRDWW
jgi:hypothetical protein